MKIKWHPVRASLAISAWFAVLVFIGMGITVPEGLWVLASAISGFYFATAED